MNNNEEESSLLNMIYFSAVWIVISLPKLFDFDDLGHIGCSMMLYSLITLSFKMSLSDYKYPVILACVYLLRYYLVRNRLINIFLIHFPRFLHDFVENIRCVAKNESICCSVLLVIRWKKS